MDAVTEIPTRDQERNARHRRICQRLIELGMLLAEPAAARAHEQLTTEPDPREEPAGLKTDPALTFVRLSTVIRQAMALEARIDAAEDAAERAAQSTQSGYVTRHHHPAGEDFREAILLPILRQAAAAQPNRPGLAEQAAKELHTQLVIDIHGIASAALILTSICQDLGLQPDYSLIPEELLDAIYPEGPPPPARIPRIYDG